MSPIKPRPSAEARTHQSGVFPPWTRLGDRRGKSANVAPTVTIFGAGIAGLSAAHELIERGFSVQVVEPTVSPEEEYAAEVGGMAANQFGRVRENPELLHGPEPQDEDEREQFRDNIARIHLLRSAQMQRVQRRFSTPWRIRFVRNKPPQSSDLNLQLIDEWGSQNGSKLITVLETVKLALRTYQEDREDFAGHHLGSWWREQEKEDEWTRAWQSREVLLVEIRGHTNGDDQEANNRRVSEAWANQVLDHLVKLNDEPPDGTPNPDKIVNFRKHFRALGVGSAEPLGDQRDPVWRSRSNRVEFRIVEQLVPGEHGYRFFPAFYRHLFDTMRRTPILDQHDQETGQTAYDRLVPTKDFGMGLSDGRPTASLQTRRVRSLEELRRHFELFFTRLGATHRDVARFQVRMLKFLTSSSERRRREYEPISWWTFLGGDAARGYSDKMARYLTEIPQALVAMNADETDARSHGNIVSQLQIQYLQDQCDSTLNGPTTSVWLREWKRYLERQGVRFFVGELGQLKWVDDDLVPVTTHLSAWLGPRRRHFKEIEPEADSTEIEPEADSTEIEPKADSRQHDRESSPEEASAAGPGAPSETQSSDRDKRADALATSGKADSPAEFPRRAKTAPVAAPPIVRPAQPRVAIEVLGNDAGDYTIWVNDEAFTLLVRKQSRQELVRKQSRQELVRKQSRQEIASILAAEVNDHPALCAKTQDSRILITEACAVRFKPVEDNYTFDFDDSFVAGAWNESDVRKVSLSSSAAATEPDQNVEDRLLKALSDAKTFIDVINRIDDVHPGAWDKAVQLASAEADRPASAEDQWSVLLSALDRHLTDAKIPKAERAAIIRHVTRELTTVSNSASASEKNGAKRLRQRLTRRHGDHPDFATLTLDAADWVSAGQLRVTSSTFNDHLTTFEKLRRPRREVVPCISLDKETQELLLAPPKWVSKVAVAEGDKAMNFAPVFPYYFRTHKEQPSILIRVQDVHGNLRVVGAPLPENPQHDYRAHEESRAELRPDFYVLALPFEAASKLVWQAESERRGQLDGCLAELMKFDVAADRRSPAGAKLPVTRNIDGRPAKEYPLRDFNGVQYYFHNQVRIGKGHIYYPDAEWGLSSISQLAYWRERMSSRGAFMGQLSVDIGNFYATAPPRRGGRFTRSAWNSTSDEIVQEVWHQVRRGLEKDRAGVLADPDYVHLDEGLLFDHPLGSTFREGASIFIKEDKHHAAYTVWVNGEPYTIPAEKQSQQVADSLCAVINDAQSRQSGTLVAVTEPKPVWSHLRPSAIVHMNVEEAKKVISGATTDQLDELQNEERRRPGGSRQGVLNKIYERRASLVGTLSVDKPILRIKSTVPYDAVLICVTGAAAGSYRLVVGTRVYRYVQTVAAEIAILDDDPQAAAPAESAGSPDGDGAQPTVHPTKAAQSAGRKAIRDGLFDRLVRTPDPWVTVKVSGDTGLILQPATGQKLPRIEVLNDQQNLNLVFGPTLHVRLEQVHGCLSFEQPETATVGYNRTPLLINVPGQWAHRPGVLNPRAIDLPTIGPGETGPEPVFYNISNRRWVAAGTFMATTTRLTSMEAANESARHAVNAILYQLVLGPGADYSAQGRMFADWAEIWDPEKHELDELEPLKRLDQKLVEEGLPHVMDILGVVDGVDALPMHGQPSQDPMANVMQLLQHAGTTFGKDWGFIRETLAGLLAQAVGRMHDRLDPLGVLRGTKATPTDVLDRIQRAVRAFMDNSGEPPKQDSGSTPAT